MCTTQQRFGYACWKLNISNSFSAFLLLSQGNVILNSLKLFQVKEENWVPNNRAPDNANLFVGEACFFLYWLGFSKVKTPNLSGSVFMPDYIFNSWEDIPKCRLITPPLPLCLLRFGWLTQRAPLNLLMRAVLGRRSCESDFAADNTKGKHGFRGFLWN